LRKFNVISGGGSLLYDMDVYTDKFEFMWVNTDAEMNAERGSLV
jgi:hypothetical protein